MEDRSEIIWDLIENSSELKHYLHEIENEKPKNMDEMVINLIDFYRDIDFTIECLLDAYQQTKILNNYSYLLRMRS